VVNLSWWKWPFWVMAAGWSILLYAIWTFASEAKISDPALAKARLYPWLAAGIAVYLTGRGLQIAARSRARRLAQEAREKEE
jgi:hypothetical protein